MKYGILIILTIILSSCQECKNSHMETIPAGYRYTCGTMVFPKYQYTCGYGYFLETTKIVCE